jgi:hypothetical protein
MKKPWLAFLLNFLFAGAGLAYLGMWAWAVLNLVIVLTIGFVLAATAPDSIGPLSAGLAASSGALAMAVAQSMNAKASAQGVVQQSYPAAPPLNFPPPPHQALPARSRAKFCGDCGAEVGTSKFCPQCGSQVQATAPEPLPVPDPPAQPVTVSGSAEASGARVKFCGDCGADVGTSKFCPQCGTKVQFAVPAANRCAGCGAVFRSPSKFCPDCGLKTQG